MIYIRLCSELSANSCSHPPPRLDTYTYNDAVQIIRQCDEYFKTLNIEPTFGTEVEFYLIRDTKNNQENDQSLSKWVGDFYEVLNSLSSEENKAVIEAIHDLLATDKKTQISEAFLMEKISQRYGSGPDSISIFQDILAEVMRDNHPPIVRRGHFLMNLELYLKGTGIACFAVIQEHGDIDSKEKKGQMLEVATKMVTSGREALRVTQQTQLAIIKVAEAQGAEVTFEAFPEGASQSAGFHIHFGLRDKKDSRRNLLVTEKNDKNVVARQLEYSLYQALPTHVVTALHTDNHIRRIEAGCYSPKTVAECIKSSEKGGDIRNYHYEYRLPAASRNNAASLAGLMLMMVRGIENVVRNGGYYTAIDDPQYDPVCARAAIDTQFEHM